MNETFSDHAENVSGALEALAGYVGRVEAERDENMGVIKALRRRLECAEDLLTEAYRQDYGTPGWRDRAQKAVRG